MANVYPSLFLPFQNNLSDLYVHSFISIYDIFEYHCSKFMPSNVLLLKRLEKIPKQRLEVQLLIFFAMMVKK